MSSLVVCRFVPLLTCSSSARSLASLVAASMMLGASSSVALAAVPGNVLLNPGFETGTLSPWYQHETYTGSENWHVTSADRVFGSYGATAVGDRSLRQNIDPVQSSDIHELSFWMKQPSVGNGIYGGVLVKFFTPTGQITFSPTVFSNQWQFYEITRNIPANRTITGFSIFGYSQEGGPVARSYIDEITLRLAPPPSFVASSFFSEPAVGAANYSPPPGADELGFTTSIQGTGGSNPRAAVTDDVDSPVLTHRSISATTLFEPVDTTKWHDVRVLADVRLSRTDYEVGDFVRVFITNGAQTVDLFSRQGANGIDGEMEAVAHDIFYTYAAAIPSSWTTARLGISSSSNSSTGAERFDFDNIRFEGTPIPVPEPQSLILAASLASAFVGFTLVRYSARANLGCGSVVALGNLTEQIPTPPPRVGGERWARFLELSPDSAR